MTRGNQREKAREKNLEKQAKQKKKNNLSGNDYKRAQEAQADIMRQKQAKALAAKEASASAGESGAKK